MIGSDGVPAAEDAPEEGAAASLHIVVHGVVQGVGFRFFVEREANSLGLAGEVRNLPDGTVEVEAEGKRVLLEALLRRVKEGPRGSVVSSVDVDWAKPHGEKQGFRISF